MSCVMRREFLAVLGAAAAWPIVVHAQQLERRIPRIGYVQGTQNENTLAFFQALREAGYVNGQNLLIETRFHEWTGRLFELVSGLVALECDVIFAASPYAIEATKRATGTIPIVGIDLESDPIANGWAASLARPGSNITGWFLDFPELAGKQIELLREALPTLSRLAVLWDSAIGEVQFRAAESAAGGAAVTVHSIPIQGSGDFNDAFTRAARERPHGMIILSSPLIYNQRAKIIELAMKSGLPTISLFTVFPKVGGLIAYGPNLPDMFKRAATYVDRILRGTKTGDLPIQRPTKFELVLNLKTAKTLGLEIPPTLLARADEVIE
jgi:putative tryptophan/tyrosine transport system substrate-binding protein